MPPTFASPHFSYVELTRSQVAARDGLDNTPPPPALACLADLCAHVLEPLRAMFGPIHISSGFRSPPVNRAANGASNSQHTLGQAADIEVDGVPNIVLAKFIRDHLPHDQVILEFYSDTDPHAGWVHVSYVHDNNRHQQLVARRGPTGKTVYSNGLPA